MIVRLIHAASTSRISVDWSCFITSFDYWGIAYKVEVERKGDHAFENLKVLLTHSLTQSDLRVRHREETKNVTRLTMENVSVLVSGR
jgi:hypothetical protein